MKSARTLSSASSLAIAAIATAQPAIEALGPLAGLEQTDAFAVSADGRVVTGRSFYPGPERALRWVDGVPMAIDACDAASPRSVSADGSALVGTCLVGVSEAGFYWSETGGFQPIEPPAVAHDGTFVGAIAGDGSLAAGYAYTAGTAQPFRWTPGSGAALLPVLPGAGYSTANAVNADGSVIVGTSGLQAVRWTDRGGAVEAIEMSPNFNQAVAIGVSAEGSTIVGYASGGSGWRAFRWTRATGMVELGLLPDLPWSLATGVSSDGRVVVGAGSIFPGIETAMVWTEPLGMLDLRGYLMDRGVDVGGWWLERAAAITPDGSTIVGWGEFEGNGRAFIVTGLDLACRADLDADGELTIFDFLLFQNLFDAGDPIADFDGDGDFTVFDFLAFQNAFDAGCP